MVPLAALDALQLALQLLIALFLGVDLGDDLAAVGCIQLLDELGHQMGVLERVLDTGQHGRSGLALPGVLAMRGGAVAGLLDLQLPPQTVQVEAAQGVGAQTGALEEAVARDVRVGVEQLRGPGEGGRGHAMAGQALEDEERLEGGVGRGAGRHAPGEVCGVGGGRRADGLGRDGSQRDGDGGYEGQAGIAGRRAGRRADGRVT